MQIKYIVDETGINFEHPPNKVMGFNPVTLDAMSEKMVRDSYKSNLKNIRSIHNDDPNIFFNPGTKEGDEKLRSIAKLPYQYLDYKKHGCFMYPYIAIDLNLVDGKGYSKTNPERWDLQTGSGRLFIQNRYFPESKYPLAHFSLQYGTGRGEVIEEYVEYVKQTSWWKDKNVSDMVAFVNLHPYPDPKWTHTDGIEVPFDEQEYRWNEKNVWFIKLIDFVPRKDAEKHIEPRLKPDYFLSKTIQSNLNKRLHKIYEEFEGEDIDLLDKFIFDNLDYVESIYDWRL